MAMKGRQKHADRMKVLADSNRTLRMVGRVLYAGSDMIRAEAFQSISRGSVSGKGHKPSKPGDPPHRDTGVLQANIETRLISPVEAQVSSEAPYAAAMEFGASIKDGFGKGLTFDVEARPYMRPARDKKEPEIRRLLVENLGKLVKGSGR